MSIAAITAAIKTRLGGVAGVGVVYEYEKFSNDSPMQPQFVADFSKDGVLNTWFIDVGSMRDRKTADDDSRYKRHHHVAIAGVLAFQGDGASAKAFRSRVEAVLTAFTKGDRTLGGAAITHQDPECDTITIAGYQSNQEQVHSAIIQFDVEELI